MPVSIRWFDAQQSIMFYTMEGRWTWDEFYPQYEQALAMEREKPHRIDVIVDLSASAHLPLSILTHVRHMSDKQPDNIGLSIIVTQNALVEALYRAGVRMHRNIARYFRVVPTVMVAEAMIAAVRQEAAGLPNQA
jgi:hypothetical protein